MIIKGGSCSGAGRLATHLLRQDHNERVRVVELRGSAASDLRGTLADMEALAAGTACKRPLYHASINTRLEERLSAAERATAIDRLEAALGLTGQPRAVVQHVKEGREHTHIVWARVDTDRHRVISDSHNFRKHEAVARELETAFGHAAVPGAHVGKPGGNRPQRTPDHDEMQQAARTGIDLAAARAQITALWRSTTTGQGFAAALKDAGWTLCRGDRREFVLVDSKGGIHGLARRLDGVNAAAIRQRLADIDPASLLNIAEARAAIRASSPQAAELVRLPRAPRRSSAKAGQASRRSGHQDADRRDDSGGGLYVTVSRHRLDYSRALMPPAANSNSAPVWSPARIKGIGQFRAQAWMTTTPCESRAEMMPRPVRPILVLSEPAAGSGDAAVQELDGLLDSIAREIDRRTAVICDGIAGEFAARIRTARKAVPKEQVAGAVRVLKQARKEAIRYAREAAAVELEARRKLVQVSIRRVRFTIPHTFPKP